MPAPDQAVTRGPDCHTQRDGRRPGRRPAGLPMDPRLGPGHPPWPTGPPRPPPSQPRRSTPTPTVTLIFTADDGAAISYGHAGPDHTSDVPPNNPPTVDAGPRPGGQRGPDRHPQRDGRRPGRRPAGLPVVARRARWPIAFEDPGSPSTTFTAPQVDSNATAILTLAATDPHNATAADQVAITITRLNAPPTVDAGPRPGGHRGPDRHPQRDGRRIRTATRWPTGGPTTRPWTSPWPTRRRHPPPSQPRRSTPTPWSPSR